MLNTPTRPAFADPQGVPLTFYVQPIIDLTTDTPIGYEWLTRPRRGGSPLDLWAWARDTGQLASLEHTVYAAAATHRARIPTRLFLNVDPAMLTDTPLQADVWRALVPVVLEVTELSVPPLVTLQTLYAAGLPLAIDDWGTGPGAFDKLARWPVEFLKLDRSLLLDARRSVRVRHLLEAVAQFAQVHHIACIAEGVELAEEAALVRQLAIPYGQGYFWARPAPLSDGYWPLPPEPQLSFI